MQWCHHHNHIRHHHHLVNTTQCTDCDRTKPHSPCPRSEAWSASPRCWSSGPRTRPRWWGRGPAGTSCPWTAARGKTCPPLVSETVRILKSSFSRPTCVPDDDVLEQVAVGHGGCAGCWRGGWTSPQRASGALEQLLCVTWGWQRMRSVALSEKPSAVSPPRLGDSILRSATGVAIVFPPARAWIQGMGGRI